MIKIISVVGARPNFIKIAPFIKAVEKHNSSSRLPKIEHILVHTGQHYDKSMSENFFNELEIPRPDINLGIGSGSHAEQVGKTMIEFEKIIRKDKPDWVVVVGDVNATLSCSVTAKKEHVKLCHIEAGLRSNDLKMPEEINRIVTDRLADLLLTPDKISTENLLNESINEDKIRFVGNIMIDTLEKQRKQAEKLCVKEIVENNTIKEIDKTVPFDNYGIVTLHRPSNVDRQSVFKLIVDFINNKVTKDIPIIWPVHPRTKKQLMKFGLLESLMLNEHLFLLNPISYREMLRLNMNAIIMFTDSGGLQEECTVLGTACITLRKNTERPITLIENKGASIIAGNKIEDIEKAYKKIIKTGVKAYSPQLWDGRTAERCLQAIIEYKC